MRAGGEVTIPPELKAVADEHGWPDDLVKRAIKLGAAPDFVIEPDQGRHHAGSRRSRSSRSRRRPQRAAWRRRWTSRG